MLSSTCRRRCLWQVCVLCVLLSAVVSSVEGIESNDDDDACLSTVSRIDTFYVEPGVVGGLGRRGLDNGESGSERRLTEIHVRQNVQV